MSKSATVANSQIKPVITYAERMAKKLTPKPRSYFNCVINPRTELGTSAAARAKAAI